MGRMVLTRVQRSIAVTSVLFAALALGRTHGTSGAVAPPMAATAASVQAQPPPTYQLLRQDVIVNADIWDQEPKMMAAGLGFTRIIGIPGLAMDDLANSERLVREAGGTWNRLQCADGQTPSLVNYTSAVSPQAVAGTYGQPVTYADGLPIEFSWPLLPSTVDGTDFKVTLNTGESVTPLVGSIWPNFEYNERSVAVIFGTFGNRLNPSDPAAVYPLAVEVVEDSTPLTLVGPGGRLVSAVGFKVSTPGSPYTDPSAAPEQRGGPKLAAAKLSRMSTEGEGGPAVFGQNLPNDGVALYGDEAQFRLRVYTTGGMTLDGVRALFPTDFSRFFRVRAESATGDVVLLTQTGVDYEIDGGTVRVLGLADLGRKDAQYTDCYTEDKDNYIDIILDGDEAAVRRITHVEIPSVDEYSPLYNPGGPGNAPEPGVRYSAPSPPISQRVWITLDDPMTVTYP